MVDGLHILKAIALSGMGKWDEGERGCGDLMNVQYKPNQNYHYEYTPPYIKNIS
jgi:hypothetical protein